MKVHERLDQELNRQGKTQAALAEAVGVSSATVSQWRAGAKTPSATNLIKIANWLGVQPSWLTYGELGAAGRPVDPKQRACIPGEVSVVLPTCAAGRGARARQRRWLRFHGRTRYTGRETGQNICDEIKAGQATVEARYTLIELSGARLDSFLEAIQFDDLLPHLEAAADSRQKVATVIRKGLAALTHRPQAGPAARRGLRRQGSRRA